MANADKNTVAEFNGPSYGTDSKTGISKFHLITPADENGNLVILTGLLNEMPEFSISVDYENGPGADWQDKLMSFMTSDVMQFASMIGSADGSFKNLIKAGTWTKKIYAGYKPGNIELSFRIYASDQLGQSSSQSWINALKNYATLNASNEFSMQNAFENIGRALKNMRYTGNEFSTILFKNLVKPNEDNRSERDKFEEENDKVSKKVSKFNTKIPTAVSNYNAKHNTNISFTISVGTDIDNSTSFFGGASTDAAVPLAARYSIVILNRNSRLDILHHTSFNKTGTIEKIGAWKNMMASDDALKTVTSADIKDFNIDEIFTKIKEECGNTDVDPVIDGIKAEYDALAENDDIYDDPLRDSAAKTIYETLNTLEATADKTGQSVVRKYDAMRVFRRFNKENGLGEKLWYLVLYPNVFFNKDNPLIVYISNWEYKYSEEFSPNKNPTPLYCDFKITCCLDQTYSRAQWYRVLAPGVRDRNKNADAASPFERIKSTK